MQNLLTSLMLIPEVSNNHLCKLDKIPRNFCFDHNLLLSFVFEYHTFICIVPRCKTINGSILLSHYCALEFTLQEYLLFWNLKFSKMSIIYGENQNEIEDK